MKGEKGMKEKRNEWRKKKEGTKEKGKERMTGEKRQE